MKNVFLLLVLFFCIQQMNADGAEVNVTTAAELVNAVNNGAANDVINLHCKYCDKAFPPCTASSMGNVIAHVARCKDKGGSFASLQSHTVTHPSTMDSFLRPHSELSTLDFVSMVIAERALPCAAALLSSAICAIRSTSCAISVLA